MHTSSRKNVVVVDDDDYDDDDYNDINDDDDGDRYGNDNREIKVNGFDGDDGDGISVC